jgi:dTDP-4-amino-4,6-dideoxygalactose transaminase
MIQINDLGRHFAPYSGELAKIAADVISSGQYVLSGHNSRFSEKFGRYIGSPYVIPVANGTDAIEISLRAVGLGSDSKIGLVGNAGNYSHCAIRAIGASPVFIDVEEDNQLMDFNIFCSEISRLDGIIVTHLFGNPHPKIELIAELCKKHDVKLIEDCAQAHGAHLENSKVGTFGDVSSFSFYPTKNLGCLGDGGAICTSDEKIFNAASKLRTYGWNKKYEVETDFGMNSRMDEIQAAFLSYLIDHLDGWNEKRIGIATRYHKEIDNPRVTKVKLQNGSVAHLYPILVDQRSNFQASMFSVGIQTDIHYPVADFDQKIYSQDYRDLNLPITTKSSSRIVSLPMNPELTESEVTFIIKSVNEWTD